MSASSAVGAGLTASAPVPGGRDEIRRAARQILSGAQFQPTPESPITVARRWVYHQLGKLFSDLLGGRSGTVGAILALAVVVAVVVLIVQAVRGTRANPVLQGTFALSGPRRPPGEWLAEAVACEARRDWRGALRCRYRALVAELAQRGLVDEVPGLTTGEYRNAVGEALPQSAGDFAGATELFERAWYGEEPTDADDAARFRSLADRVRAGAR